MLGVVNEGLFVNIFVGSFHEQSAIPKWLATH
jgi:hypothetical protein